MWIILYRLSTKSTSGVFKLPITRLWRETFWQISVKEKKKRIRGEPTYLGVIEVEYNDEMQEVRIVCESCQWSPNAPRQQCIHRSSHLMVTCVYHPRNRTTPCKTVTWCVCYVLCVRHRLTALLEQEEYFETNYQERKRMWGMKVKWWSGFGVVPQI